MQPEEVMFLTWSDQLCHSRAALGKLCELQSTVEMEMLLRSISSSVARKACQTVNPKLSRFTIERRPRLQQCVSW